jgi:NAD(P) transhydrogenase subunit beta
MCKGMNRSIFNVILGGFGGLGGGRGPAARSRPTAGEAGSAEDAAFIMKNAQSVIIVPGYGMAVAQAQHALREMADKLKKEGVEVKLRHPSGGRPHAGPHERAAGRGQRALRRGLRAGGHQPEFATADVAFVIGANDVTNPAAKTDPRQHQIADLRHADPRRREGKTVLFVKRGMSSGYAGVENELFFRDNTMMLFADAKKMCEREHRQGASGAWRWSAAPSRTGR